MATIFLVTTLASIGLPTLNNFVGEFLVLQGAAMVNFQWAVFAAVGVILSACYMLWMYQRTFFGRAPGMADTGGHGHGHNVAQTGAHDPDTVAQADPHASHEHSGFHMPDMTGREWAAILPLVILMVWMGVAAQTFLPSISASNSAMLSTTKDSVEQQVKAPPQPAQETAHAQ
jgi:NADH-quinone oxidoreductase subunit M